MQTVAQVLTTLVVQAADDAGHGDVLADAEPAVATNNPQHGDYQSNHAFRLGKALRTNPRAVAEGVVAKLPSHPAIGAVSVAGPGFINFRLDDAWVASHLASTARDPHCGVQRDGDGKTVVIDYSSPNVAKRMHVGHMRSTLIGNALHRLYAAAGWTVVADNHIGDWGTQFGKLIVMWNDQVDRAAYEADPIGELERLYTAFGTRAETDLALGERARQETAKLQAGDAHNMALWKNFIEVSLAEFDRVYERLGIRFDETLGESAYNDALPGVVEELLAKGIGEDSEGAVVVKWSDEEEGALKNTVLVIRKSDGAHLYGTTDLATLQHRTQTWDPARIVYVTDTRQQLHFKQVFAAWRQWQPEARAELDHTWFGMLSFGEGVMSTRGGNIVRFVDLLDEAVRRAREVVEAKNPDLPDSEKTSIAEAVGLGAVRYSDLSQNPQSNVTFDWDRMLSFEGNTAPYLMFGVARCFGIARKAGEAAELDVLALTNDDERALALLVLRTPEVIAGALATHRPNLLCDHLFETVSSLGGFLANHSVLHADTAEQRASRLALVEATRRVVAHGMGVLGLRVLDRM